jgi:repressor LexA
MFVNDLITPAQKRVLKAVAACEKKGDPAFVPDLVRALRLAGESSLTPTLRVLERKGVISVHGGGSKGRSRVARLTAKGRHTLSLGGLPLLGVIPAGPLREALAEPETFLEDGELLPYRDGDFLLRVRGDSMVDDGIFDGDIVLLRPGVDFHSGEIAAVLVGDAHEATLKRIIPGADPATLTLRASNPAYPDIIVPAAEVKVAGVFRGLIRHASHRS